MSAISSGNLLLVRKSQLQRCRDAEMQRCGATPEQKHLFPFRTLIQKIFNTRAVKFGFHHSFFPPLPVSILYVPRMTLRKTLTDTSAKCSTKHFSPHWEIQKLMHKISHSFVKPGPVKILNENEAAVQQDVSDGWDHVALLRNRRKACSQLCSFWSSPATE